MLFLFTIHLPIFLVTHSLAVSLYLSLSLPLLLTVRLPLMHTLYTHPLSHSFPQIRTLTLTFIYM